MEHTDRSQHDWFLLLCMEHKDASRLFVRSLLLSQEEAREVMQEVAIVLWRKFDDGLDSLDSDVGHLAWQGWRHWRSAGTRRVIGISLATMWRSFWSIHLGWKLPSWNWRERRFGNVDLLAHVCGRYWASSR